MPARQWAGSPMMSSQQTWCPVVRGPRSGFWKGLGSGRAVPKAIAIPWAIGKRISNLLSHFPRSCEMGKFLFAGEMSN